jgi:hypothetical protein
MHLISENGIRLEALTLWMEDNQHAEDQFRVLDSTKPVVQNIKSLTIFDQVP